MNVEVRNTPRARSLLAQAVAATGVILTGHRELFTRNEASKNRRSAIVDSPVRVSQSLRYPLLASARLIDGVVRRPLV